LITHYERTTEEGKNTGQKINIIGKSLGN